MSTALYTALPNFNDIVERYGPILLFGSLVYSVVGMITYLWMVSSGVAAPAALVPPGLGDLARKTMSLWSDVYSAFSDGSLSYFEALKLAGLIGSAGLMLLGLLAQTAINYIWIAVQISELVPPPYQFITIVVWAVLGVAQLILLLYIVQRLTPMINDIARTLATMASRLLPV